MPAARERRGPVNTVLPKAVLSRIAIQYTVLYTAVPARVCTAWRVSKIHVREPVQSVKHVK